MIGWMLSIAILGAGLVNNNMTLIITSGLFAIAGSIGYGFITLQNALGKLTKTQSELRGTDIS